MSSTGWLAASPLSRIKGCRDCVGTASTNISSLSSACVQCPVCESSSVLHQSWVGLWGAFVDQLVSLLGSDCCYYISDATLRGNQSFTVSFKLIPKE